ncbi:GNAT family N-acetyltransferase [Seonamhaeicola marinus]|uniref:GNAT family N-acetyltransferase n=1 Tax=Seonamhaeicola marinus TaxID=1912246 RepID=A0A5D0HRH7_9FLAO|nr:GNAT family N-acetyltransferase [Seonamhaeicola marinus]TYA73934.1 GNAT family N-acetyltransferase [Seonamhaeicola marinus]
MVVTYHRASTNEELDQILELQRTNLISFVSEAEKQKEGFVTVHHTFEVLEAMNNSCAHIIAKYNDKVVGYALSMPKAFREDVEILKPMFHHIDFVTDKNLEYIVMGQICVDKNFRGKGVFRGLYNHMKKELQHQFDAIITLIDVKNVRSINAHNSVGFQLLKNFSQGDKSLNLVILDI